MYHVIRLWNFENCWNRSAKTVLLLFPASGIPDFEDDGASGHESEHDCQDNGENVRAHFSGQEADEHRRQHDAEIRKRHLNSYDRLRGFFSVKDRR